MNWFNVIILKQGSEEIIFQMPIQAPMHNSVEGRFNEFLDSHPEYKELLDSFGEYDFRSEHMTSHLQALRDAG